MPETAAIRVAATPGRSGAFYAVAAYGLWGLFPAYFLLLVPAGPIEIVAWRVLFSVVFCALVITAMRKWPTLVAIVKQPRLLFTMGLAAILIFINWQVYVYATLSGQVVASALGYFINPIVTILLGVIFLRERLRIAQWTAVGISAIAVALLAINYGEFPWISLALAFSFALYGLIKNLVGGKVDALSGLTIETTWLIPVAIAQLVFVGFTTGVTFGNASIGNTLLLMSAGVVTAVPLLLFAAGASRLPLVYLGLIQYLTPLLQFVFGVFVMHEAMPFDRWMGFGLVWIALMILSVDMVASGRAARRALPLPG